MDVDKFAVNQTQVKRLLRKYSNYFIIRIAVVTEFYILISLPTAELEIQYIIQV